MKKLMGLVLGVLLAWGSVAWAAPPACTAVTSFDKEMAWSLSSGVWQTVYRVKLTCVGSGGDDDEVLLSSYLTDAMMARILGGALYKVHTGPGGQAPDDAVAIGLDGDLGEDWQTITTTSLATKVEEWSGGSKIFWDLQIDLPDLGNANDVIILYFTIVR